MPRLADTILQSTPFHAHRAPIVDIKQGGSFGHMIDYKALVSANPYVRQHIIAVVLQSPRGFKYMPQEDLWHRSFKAIIEEQSKQITGLQSTLSISNVEHNVGGAGELIHAVSDVTRAVSEPSHTIYEKYNLPITIFINSWITELMMDPETKYPNIITRPEAEGKLTDHMVDFYGGTVLYFEPDPTFTKVLRSWLCMFVRPKDSGPTIEGSKDPLSAKSDLEITLNLTATTQIGAGVNELAQKVLTSLRPTNTNPHQAPAAVNDIDANVTALKDTGYKEKMEQAAAEALKL